jgi:hypothetical protein
LNGLLPGGRFRSQNEARIPWFLAMPFAVILGRTLWKLIRHGG